MEFKTIYIFQETFNEIIDLIPNEKGIILINGNEIKKESKNKSPYNLFVRIGDNMNTLLKQVIEYNGDEINISHISYKKIEDDLELCKTYLYAIKKNNPELPFRKKVREQINKLNLPVTKQYYYEGSFNKINRKLSITGVFIPKEELNKIPNTSGVYFIYNKNKELLYVGESVNLNIRIKEHFSGRTNTWDIYHNFKYIKYIEIVDITLLSIYETYYINLYKPKLNLSKVFSYKSERYNPKYNIKFSEFVNLEHMIRYEIAKIFVEKKFKVSELLYEKKRQFAKEMIALEELFL